jgi:hypothetical protein
MAKLGPTTKHEKEHLEAHVDLCAERYRNLDDRLSNLEKKVDMIQQDILHGQQQLRSTIIKSTTAIITGVLAVVVTILIKF